MLKPVAETIKTNRFLCHAVAMTFICVTFLLQSTLVNAAPSATFRIQHKVSGYDLLQAYGGTRNDKRLIDAWPSQGFGEDKSFRWYFDPVLDEDGIETGYFYIHNLKTGLVLTQNPNDDYVENLARFPEHVEREDFLEPLGQHWSLVDTSANDVSVMIINRYKDILVDGIRLSQHVQHALTQAHGGTEPGIHNVETKSGYTSPVNRDAFSWYLRPAGDVELTQLWIEDVKCISPSTGIDEDTEGLFDAIGGLGLATIHLGIGAVTCGPWCGIATYLADRALDVNDKTVAATNTFLTELAIEQ